MAVVETAAGSVPAPAAPRLLGRLLRDRVGAAALAVVLLFLLLALAAPLIAALYGKNPVEHYGQNSPACSATAACPSCRTAASRATSGSAWSRGSAGTS